uniref:Uncharacterized protein n=1 Tax=Candidatus Kentrum sp. MB TaxID=2138164 RepID=A0A450XAJ3_9GAMM|nr:MAG: hypothetical protein BECKMB1821G_GA0114241_101918 [Candidatus Kentron sp. MB]
MFVGYGVRFNFAGLVAAWLRHVCHINFCHPDQFDTCHPERSAGSFWERPFIFGVMPPSPLTFDMTVLLIPR